MEYTKEQIDNRLEKLPSDLREAIDSIETTKLIVEIGENNNLHIDQTGDLVDETGLTMLGFKNSTRFANNIQERLKITPEQAEKITAEINQKIFSAIRDSVRKIHEEHSHEDLVEDSKKPAEIVGFGGEESVEEESFERNKILEEIESPEKIEAVVPVGFEEGSDEGMVNHMKESLDSLRNLKTETKLEENKEEEEKPSTESQKDENPSDVQNIPEEKTAFTQDLQEAQEKNTLQKENIDVPETPKEEDVDNIVESKLTGVTKVATQEKELNSDPYREPIE